MLFRRLPDKLLRHVSEIKHINKKNVKRAQNAQSAQVVHAGRQTAQEVVFAEPQLLQIGELANFSGECCGTVKLQLSNRQVCEHREQPNSGVDGAHPWRGLIDVNGTLVNKKTKTKRKSEN